MVTILILPTFISAVFQLIIIFYKFNETLSLLYDVLTKFATLWIICLAICHYKILKAFKGKYRQYPFGIYIACASLLSLAIASVSSIQLLSKNGYDVLAIDGLAFLVLSIISVVTYHFKEEIKFGPYSVAREAASNLIKFSYIQAFFAAIYTLQDGLEVINGCLDENFKSSESELCVGLNFSDLLVYQSWVWFAVFSSWKMFSLNENEGNEHRTTQESLSASGSLNSLRTSAFLSSGI